MAKVTQPLGSDEAHGQIHKAIIFQGRTAKQYKVPARVISQSGHAANMMFRDYNAMMKSAGVWVRKALLSVWGVDWFGIMYQRVALLFSEYPEFVALWEAEDEEVKNEWRAQAPYQQTEGDCGEVFFFLAVSIWIGFESRQMGYFGMLNVVNSTAEAARVWWDRYLAPAFVIGKYDDDHPDIEFSEGDWSTDVAGWLYGGSCHHSASNASPWYAFYFLGSYLTLHFTTSVAYAAMNVQVDGFAPLIVPATESVYQETTAWTCPHLPYGLHRVHVQRDGQEGSFTFDAFEISE